MKKFAFCKCFYTNNIYIRSWDRHITFKSDEQFREDYKSFSSVELAMIEAEAEIARRMDGRNRWKERREIIAKKYSPIFANKLASYSNEFEIAPVFEGAFKDAIKLCKSQPNPLQLPAPITKVCSGIYTLPVFTPELCSQIIDEVLCFKKTKLLHERPNSMNRGGILLDDLPFYDNFLMDFRKVLEPIFKLLYPNSFGGNSVTFDSHKAFIVKYSCDGRYDSDVDLASHFDNAEATINISLSEDHEGGELVFNAAESHQSFGLEHKLGIGVLHLGSRLHQALPITHGERWNLIMWVRSSEIRNIQCPMCGLDPEKIAAPVGSYGDGFTLAENEPSSALCTMA